ncbi:hypothetical protein HG263_16245 [Pseudoalteromonas sp. JBTF-M23]|uniref:Uncharacterized protein n=1 Tax=Pseudoalteromonas caenipelagi TaxID=2726988 RepID=A0A849VJW4_9GAMM|nr:hypothetical protein [Pseudoalteromonas caenipelagi]NOU52084.1 hypothetical protein [Pseudoalteromonas caenipelagi]
MTIKYYPLLLCLEESIEYIDSPHSLEQSTFYLTTEQKNQAVCVLKDGNCCDLLGNEIAAIQLQPLTELVQQALMEDGQCCVQKISLQTYQQAFELLKQLHN